MLVTFMVATFWDLLGSGPTWEFGCGVVQEPCQKYWWANALFIGEWLNTKKCLSWIWYIDNDMVFFFFLPFLILIYLRMRKWAYHIFTLIVISNMIYTFTISEIEGLGLSMVADRDKYNKLIYRRPWGRYGVYVLGVIIGALYFEYRNQDKHQELRGTFGSKFFGAIHLSRKFRHTLFVIGFIIINVAIFSPLKELQGFTEPVWP